MFGKCLPKFAQVERVFRQNFLDGWERDGASVAVYWQGQLVVDLYGGFAESSALAKWTPNTRTVLFSATKARKGTTNYCVLDFKLNSSD